jgi:hypothetical protein
VSARGPVGEILRRVAGRPAGGGAQSCDLCATALEEGHEHLLETGTARLLCACRACSILFPSTARPRFKRVPRRVRRLGGFDDSGELWAALSIPVGMAFFVPASEPRGVIAVYPSPGGPTPAQVDPDSWRRVVEAEPAVGELEADVEALLVDRRDARREAYLAPIDRCYELVGLVRVNWKGLSGGPGVRSALDRFFERLRASAEVAPRGGA